MKTYNRPWEFTAGWVGLILWIPSAVLFIVFAVLFTIQGSPAALFELLLFGWALTNIVKYALELRYNINRRKEAAK